MAKDAVFFTYTSDTWAWMIKTPGDRTAAMRQLAAGWSAPTITITAPAAHPSVAVDPNCPRPQRTITWRRIS
jgi:hypothetical protein